MTLWQLFGGFRTLAFPVKSGHSEKYSGDRHVRLALETLERRTLLSYTFHLIADNGPDSPFASVGSAPTINDSGTVAFRAQLKNGVDGVWTSNGDGDYTTIVNTIGPFMPYFLATIGDDGTVAFATHLRDGNAGIFTGRGGPLTAIATSAQAPFNTFDIVPDINAEGTVVFRADLVGGGQAIVTGAGGPLTFLATTGPQFSGFGTEFHTNPTINNQGVVAFNADLTGGGQGVFTITPHGNLTAIATTADGYFHAFIPDNGRTPAINDAGDVAFWGQLEPAGTASGLYLGNGGPLSNLRFHQNQDLSTGVVLRVALNNFGQPAYMENNLDEAGQYIGSAIYTGSDPNPEKVIAAGDALLGSTVSAATAFNFSWQGRGLNDAGQLVFELQLTDGRSAIIRADPAEGTAHGSRGKGVAVPTLGSVAVASRTWLAHQRASLDTVTTLNADFIRTGIIHQTATEAVDRSQPSASVDTTPTRAEQLDWAFAGPDLSLTRDQLTGTLLLPV